MRIVWINLHRLPEGVFTSLHIFLCHQDCTKNIPWISLVGMLIGTISSLIGIGGGALTGPFQLWHGIRAQNAVATSAACGFPIAVAGTLSFVAFGYNDGLPGGALGYVHLPAMIGIALTSALAAPLGAATVHRLSPGLVKKLFGGFLILVGLRMLSGF